MDMDLQNAVMGDVLGGGGAAGLSGVTGLTGLGGLFTPHNMSLNELTQPGQNSGQPNKLNPKHGEHNKQANKTQDAIDPNGSGKPSRKVDEVRQ